MSKYLFTFFLVCGIALVAVIIGLALTVPGTPAGELAGMKKFSSIDELSSYLIKTQNAVSQGIPAPIATPLAGGRGLAENVMDAPAQKGGMPVFQTMVPTYAPAEYSATNLQVQGVDEADFVKTDGNYLYLVSRGELVIIDAYPAEEADIVSRTSLPGQPVELFVWGKYAVVFYTGQDELLEKAPVGVAPVPRWETVTHACIYDISNRSLPLKSGDITASGSYYGSRMIGNSVYLVTSQPLQWRGERPIVPMVQKDGAPGVTPDIYYYDIPDSVYLYYTITSFRPGDPEAPVAESFLAGYSTTLYVSEENLYLAYRKDAAIPRWQASTLAGSGPEAVMQPVPGTVIHRFAIGNGKVSYQATGQVPGQLLNQFSMDEYGQYLRVATTVEGWTSSRSTQSNSVYTLDQGMNIKGRLENIAPDERIYATRFMGDRLYMVTFKRMDPFFVIDLSDPSRPAVLGMLKIPGYSDYLHPYDANHIIGLGKETRENQWGGVSTSGLKLALFDVSDVNNPVVVDKVEIGEAGSDSEALRDHKAFLFSRQKDLLVIPVWEVKNVPVTGRSYPSYQPEVWQGAYAFSVSPERGFALRGKVTHYSWGTQNQAYYYGTMADTVRRALYIDDVLYTISPNQVVMTSLGNMDTRIKEIDLPGARPGGTWYGQA